MAIATSSKSGEVDGWGQQAVLFTPPSPFLHTMSHSAVRGAIGMEEAGGGSRKSSQTEKQWSRWGQQNGGLRLNDRLEKSQR